METLNERFKGLSYTVKLRTPYKTKKGKKWLKFTRIIGAQVTSHQYSWKFSAIYNFVQGNFSSYNMYLDFAFKYWIDQLFCHNLCLKKGTFFGYLAHKETTLKS